jgi:hypothetical protein
MLEPSNKASKCPDCGAILPNGLTCRSVFDEFIALELTDPEFGAVHLLTVACYMIQHGGYTDEALIWIEGKLRDYLEKGIPTEQIRQKAQKETPQDRRKWKVSRRSGDPPQVKIPWSMTIVAVATNYHNAESYRELIKQWARTTLEEMKPLLPGSKE